MENQDTNILQDFNIRTDCVIVIVLINKKNQQTFIVDVTMLWDFHVKDKEANKISKYQDLAMEIS